MINDFHLWKEALLTILLPLLNQVATVGNNQS